MLERLRTLPPHRQLLLAAAAGLILLVALLLGWQALRTRYEPLLTQLRPSEAAGVVAELDRRKLGYRLADGGHTILVPADALDRTRVAVLGTGLAEKSTVGFELFNKSDMGLTDFAQRINFQRALQGELERTILALDGVEAVRVHLAMGENRLFSEDQVPPKASIMIRMRDGIAMSNAAARGVQRLVAAAVPRLAPEQVVVLDEAGDVIGQQPAQNPSSVTLTPLAQSEKAIGDYYAARVRDALQRQFPALAIAVAARAMPRDGGEEQALAAWTPATRVFPLEVTLAPASPLDQTTSASVRALAEAAVGFAAARGDAILFGPVAGAVPVPVDEVAPASPTPSPTPAPESSDDQSSGFRMWLTRGVMAAAMLLALLWLAGRMRRRELSDAQRASLVTRLREALDRERLGGANV